MNKTYVVLFKARNKDNKHIENFKQVQKSFLSSKSEAELYEEFENFCDKYPTYNCRFYRSVNARSDTKVKNALLHYLVDNTPAAYKLPSLVVRLANKPENRDENKWLLDLDEHLAHDEYLKFLHDVTLASNNAVEQVKETPNGYHVVVTHGFDTRDLCDKYPNLEVKRDDMLYVDSHFVNVKTSLNDKIDMLNKNLQNDDFCALLDEEFKQYKTSHNNVNR